MFPFENLEVYKKAKETHSLIVKLLSRKNEIPIYLKSQLGRAALSIALNIAEGSSRFARKDRRHFFVIARGSAFECAAIIQIIADEKLINESISQQLRKYFDEISRILFVMIRNLEKPE